MRGAHELPGVSIVTVASVRESTGLVANAERFRADSERKVARQSLEQQSWTELAGTAQLVEAASLADVAIHTSAAHRLVNLSGAPWPPSAGSAQLVFELHWDGERPEGLGLRRARGRPPKDVIVTCRSSTGQTRVVQRSTLTLTPATPAGDRRNAASRSVALLLRALGMSDNELSVGETSEPPPPSAKSRSGSLRVPPAVGASIGVAAAAVFRRVSRGLWRDDAWEIQYRTNSDAFVANSDHVSANGFKAYRPGYDRFVADPIPFSHHDIHAVFFEEYPFATRKGVISCAVLQANGELGVPQRVLERRYHLSYPFVFRDDDRVYMVPESAANRTIDLYECTSFPHQWEYRKTLLDNISANDATFYQDGTRWWMFATVSGEGAYAWDELHLFFADEILGEWQPHPMNPVKCDSRSARPAGPLFVKAGRLLRPTQDCSETYGGAVSICEIEELTPTCFRERTVDRLDPDLFPGAKGLHTLAATGAIETVDIRPRRRMRWERGTI